VIWVRPLAPWPRASPPIDRSLHPAESCSTKCARRGCRPLPCSMHHPRSVQMLGIESAGSKLPPHRRRQFDFQSRWRVPVPPGVEPRMREGTRRSAGAMWLAFRNSTASLRGSTTPQTRDDLRQALRMTLPEFTRSLAQLFSNLRWKCSSQHDRDYCRRGRVRASFCGDPRVRRGQACCHYSSAPIRPGRRSSLRGGRCNFTNVHCRPETFCRKNRHFRQSALADFRPGTLWLSWRSTGSLSRKKLGQLSVTGTPWRFLDMLIPNSPGSGAELPSGGRSTVDRICR